MTGNIKVKLIYELKQNSKQRINNILLVLDNPSIHKTTSIKQDLLLNQHHLFLHPYSPKLNPIELFWANVKQKFRQKIIRADLALYHQLHQVKRVFLREVKDYCLFLIQMDGKFFFQGGFMRAKINKFKIKVKINCIFPPRQKKNFICLDNTKKSDKLQYAVKAFEKCKMMNNEIDKKALVKEMQIMRKVNYKGLIKMHEVFEDDTHIFLVQDYLQGGELYG